MSHNQTPDNVISIYDNPTNRWVKTYIVTGERVLIGVGIALGALALGGALLGAAPAAIAGAAVIATGNLAVGGIIHLLRTAPEPQHDYSGPYDGGLHLVPPLDAQSEV